METVLGNLQAILSLVRKAVLGIETVSVVKRFSNIQDLNLKNEGGGKGVRHFTCRNIGKSIMYISTGEINEKEPINPNETFAINSPHRVCDEQIKITFGAEHPDFVADATRSKNDGIIRFLVDKC